MKALLLNDKVLKGSIAISMFIPSFAHAEAEACVSDPNQASNPISSGATCSKSKSNADNLFGADGIFHTIANTLIYIIGAVAVIMLIIGGFRYVVSQGSKDGVQQAKDTILYSVIGIIVAILAYAIVNFVTGALAPTNTP